MSEIAVKMTSGVNILVVLVFVLAWLIFALYPVAIIEKNSVDVIVETLALEQDLSGTDLSGGQLDRYFNNQLVPKLEADFNDQVSTLDSLLIKKCELELRGPVRGAMTKQDIAEAAEFTCTRDWFWVFAFSSLWAGVVALLCLLLPKGIDPIRQGWLLRLAGAGVPIRDALDVTHSMNEGELQRFLERVEEGSVAEARAFARSKTSLVIDLPSQKLILQGQTVPMKQTPFFYYCWYAYCRQSGDGWYANPQRNRPGREDGNLLAEMMKTYGGSTRAIRELEEIGLKAKVLDQNRSKIKDAIISQLGAHSAEPYLFDSDNYQVSGKNRYRLAIDAADIRIIDPECVLKAAP